MTQPPNPQQPPTYQPTPPRPQADQDLPNPGRMEKRPPRQKRFGFVAVGVATLVGLVLGGAVMGTDDTGTTTATPAPTATRTVTAPPVGEGEGTEAPDPEPTEAPPEEPAGWNPKPKDFKVGVKVTDKQCFGSAGCNISYKIKLDLLTAQEIPAEGTTDITYRISGAEDPIIGTITLDSDGRFESSEESASTTSSSKTLVAKVTEVDYNEFG